ncbi:hypothetical protein Xen7305DRAFT_00045250 [Xenococcus sp. PCC 7305]|uniref:hypothetical protein n=1 Tax=Xenococcus sp. PCC 7305 TaxID=102125 RepID=UPI0002AC5ABE|nr:hypothetical protein [Xenococcus sp. PCC 7305]ELS04789.1 hypothetical protein Xen7305DRAFT_00045250 [Xenococcus sp. PCC 7305]
MDSEFVTRKIKKRDNPIPLLDQLEKLNSLQKDNSKKYPYPYDEKQGIIRIPKTVEKELKKLIKNGKKIEAMKQVRDLTGSSLRVSKDYIDFLSTIF